MQKAIKFWAPPLLWALIIFLFSSNPTGQASQIHWQDFIIKKLAHVIEYGFLTLLMYRGLVGYGVKRKRAIYLAILTAVIYGATDEIHQSFTPGREPRARDVIFDTIGASITGIFLWKLLPSLPPRLKSWAAALDLNLSEEAS